MRASTAVFASDKQFFIQELKTNLRPVACDVAWLEHCNEQSLLNAAGQLRLNPGVDPRVIDSLVHIIAFWPTK